MSGSINAPPFSPKLAKTKSKCEPKACPVASDDYLKSNVESFDNSKLIKEYTSATKTLEPKVCPVASDDYLKSNVESCDNSKLIKEYTSATKTLEPKACPVASDDYLKSNVESFDNSKLIKEYTSATKTMEPKACPVVSDDYLKSNVESLNNSKLIKEYTSATKTMEPKACPVASDDYLKNNVESFENSKLIKEYTSGNPTLEPEWLIKRKAENILRSVSENETSSVTKEKQEKISSTSSTTYIESQEDGRETLTFKTVSISKSVVRNAVKVVDSKIIATSEHHSINGETVKAISSCKEQSLNKKRKDLLDQKGGVSPEKLTQASPKERSPDLCLNSFQSVLKSLGLEDYYPARLGLSDLKVLISSNTQGSSKNVWSFLEEILLLDADNPSAFNKDLKLSPSSKHKTEAIENSFWNCHDAMIVLYMCSDLILRRHLVSLLQAWELPFPFILPTTNEIGLWASRTNRVADQVCLSSSPLPFISAVQLGDLELFTPSKLLNSALGGGKLQKLFTESKISAPIPEGMVEMNCHFPKGNRPSGFNFPVMAAHVIGDGQTFTRQSRYLCEISDIVCIISQNVSQVTEFLESFCKDKRVLIIVNNEESIGADIQSYIDKRKASRMKVSVIKCLHNAKEALLSFGSQELTQIPPTSLEKRVEKATKHGFYLDEDNKDCKEAKSKAEQVFFQLQKSDNTAVFQGILMKSSRDQSKVNKNIPSNESDATMIPQNDLESAITLSFETFLNVLKNTRGDQLQYFFDWLKLCLTTRNITGTCKDKQNEEQFCQGMQRLDILLKEVFYYWKVSESSSHNIAWIPEVLASLAMNGYPLQVIDLDTNVSFENLAKEVLCHVSTIVGKDNKVCAVSCIGKHENETLAMFRTMFGTTFSQATTCGNSRVSMELLKVPSDFYSQLKCQFIALFYTSESNRQKTEKFNVEQQQYLTSIMSRLADVVIYTVDSENIRVKDTVKDLCSTHFILEEKATQKETFKSFCLLIMGFNQESTQACLKTIKKSCLDFCDSKPQKREQGVLPTFSNPFTSSLKPIIKHKPKFSDQHLFSQMKRSKYLDLTRRTKSWLFEVVAGSECSTLSMLQNNVGKLTETESSKYQALDCISLESPKTSEDLQNILTAKKTKIESRINNWVKETETKILSSACILKDQKQSIISEGNEVIHKEISNLESELKDLKEDKLESKIEKTAQENVKHFSRKLSSGMLHAILKSCQQLDEKIKQSNGFIRGMNQLQNLQRRSKEHNQEQTLKKIEDDFQKLSEIYFEKGSHSSVDINGVEAHETLRRCLKERFGDGKQWLLEITHPSLTHEVSNKDVQLSPIYRWTIGRYQWVEWLTGNLQWKLNLQELADKILKQSGRDIEALCSKPALLTEDHCEKVIDNIEKRIQENECLEYPWSLDFKLDILNTVCNFAITAFHDMEEQYRTYPDCQQVVEEVKEKYKKLIFKPITQKKQVKIFQKEVVAGILISCQKRLPVIITECLKEEKKNLFNIEGVYKELLAHIKQKHKFEVYMSYISDFKELATSWMRTEIIHFLEEDVGGKTRFSRILQDKAKNALQSLKTILKEVEKEADEDYGNFLRAVWMKALSKSLELGLDDRCVKRLEFLSVADLEGFIHIVEGKLMTDTLKQVTRKINKLNIEKEIRNADPRIEEQIHDVLMCSEGAQCPFCGAPCTKLGPHSVHSTDVHYPQGINGYRDTKSKQLVFRNCYESFSTNRSFKTEDTNGKPCSYSKYRKIHPDWEIKPQDTHHEHSHFWKKFFHDFNDQLAEYYDSRPARFPK